MATEKATDTTATQNPAPSPKAPARARATRAKTSGTSGTSAQASGISPQHSTTPPMAASPDSPAPKSARAKAPAAKKSAPRKAAKIAEIPGEAVAVERTLLEIETSKSLLSPSTAKPACKAHCGQCGREMRFVPFTLSNLMCRSCYGLDRYRRPASPSLSSLTAPRPSGPR